MFDYLVIGGGIIGLNIAINLKERFPNKSIAILEKEAEVGEHSSGRNSGVLHAGFYYTADSLKAKFTKEGNQKLRQFCTERGLKINECQKVVVAQNEEELTGLEELKRRGDVNGTPLEWLSEQEVSERFPKVRTHKKALLSPLTATVDPKEVTLEFKKLAQELGIEIFLGTKYERRLEGNRIKTNQGVFEAELLINASGLYADKIAKEFGFSRNYVIIPFKGVYLKDHDNVANLNTNIYPVPNLKNPFLGVHYTLTVNNESKIGPTAIPAFWRENYKGFSNFKLNELLQILFYEAKLFVTDAFGFRKLAIGEVKKYSLHYLKGLATLLTNNMDQSGFNEWSKPGIRAQLLNTQTLELVQDFVVEADAKSVHVLNAVSPAFTSSMPFANWVIEEHILKK